MSIQRIAFSAIAFGLAAGAIILVEFMFLSDGNFQPRGAGWIVLPTVAGITAWRYAGNLHADGRFDKIKIWMRETKSGRVVLVGFLGWFVVWTIYCNSSESFDSYSWTSGDWFTYLFGIVAAPFLLMSGQFVLRWINEGKNVA